MQNEQDLVLKEFAKLEAMLDKQGQQMGIGDWKESLETVNKQLREKKRQLQEESEELVDYDPFELVKERLEQPDSYLQNGLLEASSLMLVAGEPKVGKTQLILNLLIKMALGQPYLGLFVPTRPLNVYYLQTEVKKYTLYQRLKANKILNSFIDCKERGSIRISKANKKIKFDNDGIKKIVSRIRQSFGIIPPDIICVDPLRNLYFADNKGNDNTVEGMQEFFSRLEMVRDIINPKASIILIHHTRKIGTKSVKENPFDEISGTGYLRGYYDTGIVFCTEDKSKPNEVSLFIEMRDGAPGNRVPHKISCIKEEGDFIPISTPTVEQVEHTPKPNKDLQLQHRLVELVQNEALEGRVYTMNSFAEEFENKEDLPSNKTIRRKLDKLAALQLLKFFNNPQAYGIAENPKELMYLCVPGMIVTVEEDIHLTIKVTHYKCPVKNILCAIE